MRFLLYTKQRIKQRKIKLVLRQKALKEKENKEMHGVKWFAWYPIKLVDTDQLAWLTVVYRRLECSWVSTSIGSCWRPTHYKYYANWPTFWD